MASPLFIALTGFAKDQPMLGMVFKTGAAKPAEGINLAT
jgi:hypothetical protein